MTAFDALWSELEPVGRARSGGYRRFVWDAAESTCREWFVGAAGARSLDVVTDRNGNLWAWRGDPDRDGPGVVVGSHLDSVADGGAYDGPLGVVSAFAALDAVRGSLTRPVAVVAFADEEGARFGLPCAGSRLLTGAADADAVRALRDRDGVSWAEAAGRAGVDVSALGRDDESLRRIGCYVELHVEQGRHLALPSVDAAVGVGSGIWPHGRFRLEIVGSANHAGTTRLADRDDPMLALAQAVLTARDAAERYEAVATIGRLDVEPGSTNAIPSLVRAWLDARAPSEESVRSVLRAVCDAAGVAAATESWSPAVAFDAGLSDRVAAAVSGALGEAAPKLATGAGHDAGILAAAGLPTAMLFVRNPTGVSHAPGEYAERDDCLAGVRALARVLEDLAC